MTNKEICTKAVAAYYVANPDVRTFGWVCDPTEEGIAILDTEHGKVCLRRIDKEPGYEVVNKKINGQAEAKKPEVVVNNYAQSIHIGESKFDGGLAGLIGYNLLAIIITVCTFGLAYPWMLCMIQRWETRHTIIDGHRLRFNGTGGQLIGKWIVWLLLTLVTVGIYSLWLPIRIKQWTVKHTSIEA